MTDVSKDPRYHTSDGHTCTCGLPQHETPRALTLDESLALLKTRLVVHDGNVPTRRDVATLITALDRLTGRTSAPTFSPVDGAAVPDVTYDNGIRVGQSKREQSRMELMSEVANLRITREEDGRYIKRTEAELVTLRQQLTHIRALHTNDHGACHTCGVTWPCPTNREINR